MSNENEIKNNEEVVQKEEKLRISKSTIFRTIMLIIVIVNIILQKCGVYNFNISKDAVATILDGIFSLGVIISSWWYNNSFSEKALKAQKYLEDMKKEKYEEENK